MKYFELTKEEKKILNDVESGHLRSVPGIQAEKRRFRTAARYTLGKTKNINIRLSEKIVLRLKAKAAQEGIPYQTLAASILHRFANAARP